MIQRLVLFSVLVGLARHCRVSLSHPNDAVPERRKVMDLQAAQMMRAKRSMVSRVTVLVCFSLACALLIGSLISPSRAHPNPPFQMSVDLPASQTS